MKRALTLLIPVLTACTDGVKDDTGTTQEPVANPLVVVTEVEGPDAALQYLHVLADWPEGGELDYGRAVELGEFPYVRAEHGAVFVYRPEDSTLEKFLVDEDLTIRSDVKISFAGQGITGWTAEPIYVSETQAFLVDEGTAQIIEWNPQRMEIVTSTPVDASLLTRDGLPLQFQQGVASNGRAFTAVNWRDWGTFEYYEAAVMGIFDVADPASLTLVEHPACTSSVALNPFIDEEGYAYLVGDGGLGFDVMASPNRATLPQCVVRIAPGEDTFDPDFFVDIQAATGSPGFYTAHPMPDRHLLVNIWSPDVDITTVADPENPYWYWDYPPYFEYAIVDLEAGTSIPVPDLPRAAVQFSVTLRVDGESYVQLYREDGGADLYHVATDATVTKVLVSGAAADVQYLGRL
ncbi:MAG: DUF4374 domain-containing protein [Myxococcota bacterium]